MLGRVSRILFITGLIGLLSVSGAFGYQQSPMLDDMDLPPVEDRLPVEPLEIDTFERTGEYGGQMRLAMMDPFATGTIHSGLYSEGLVSWCTDGVDVVPNLAKDFEVSEDGLVYTFYLREGVKWSDGEPFTTEDIEFWYEDNLLHDEITPAIPGWLRSGGEPVELNIIDDYTFEFILQEPNMTFLDNMAFQSGGASFPTIMTQPKHFLKDYHPDYVGEDQVQEMAEDHDFDAWYDFYYEVRDFRINPDIPVITAWHPTTELHGREIQYWERNPYYWKVDEEGQQLPYICEVSVQIVGDREVLNMMVAGGEIDFDFANMTLPDYPFLREHEGEGNYRTLLWNSTLGSQLQLAPNLNHEDPVLNELFNTLDFRIALSKAIDRESINEFSFMGLAEPRQATILDDAPYFKPEFAEMYAEYDPERANEILDEIGLDERDDEGIRLRPDGEPLRFVLEYPTHYEFGPYDDIVDFVADNWRDLGIDVAVRPIGVSIHFEKSMTTEMDFVIWAYGRGLHPFIAPNYVFPSAEGRSTGALEYARWWLTDGEEGKEPDGDILWMMERYDDYLTEVDDEKRLEIGTEIIETSVSNLLYIGTVGNAPLPVIAKENLRNVPSEATRDWVLVMIGHLKPEQFFFTDF